VDDLNLYYFRGWIGHRFGGTPEEQDAILKRFQRFFRDHPGAVARDLSWSEMEKLILVENISGRTLHFDFDGDGG
jgi:hypothetical protein